MSRSSWVEGFVQDVEHTTSPTREGALQALSLPQSSNPLNTPKRPRQQLRLWTERPAPAAPPLPFPLPESLTRATPQKAVPRRPGGERPPEGWGGRGRNARLRVQSETLASQLEGTSGNSAHLYPNRKKPPSLQPECNLNGTGVGSGEWGVGVCSAGSRGEGGWGVESRRESASVSAKSRRSTVSIDGCRLHLQDTPPGPEVRNAVESWPCRNKLCGSRVSLNLSRPHYPSPENKAAGLAGSLGLPYLLITFICWLPVLQYKIVTLE